MSKVATTTTPTQPTADAAVLEVRDLGVTYGEHTVLHSVNFAVGTGEMIAVIGPNGAGKSTLFKAICGLVNHSGDVEVNGVHCHDRADRMDIAYIPQRNDSDLTFPITVEQLVATGRRRFRSWYQRRASGDDDAVRDAMHQVGIEAEATRNLFELSGGQLQRAYLARALTQQASIVLLDEAMSGVDQPTVFELLAVFEQMRSRGTTLLVATHDLGLARHRFARCLAVNRGVLADGPPASVLTGDVLESTFGHGAGGMSWAG